MRYRYTGTTPDNLANGRPLAFGDFVVLTRRQEAQNARLIEAGLLVLVPQAPRKLKPTQESDK